MANMKYNFSSGNNGTVNYNSDIVKNIVEIATQEVEGVHGMTGTKGVRLDFEKDGVYVDVTVSVYYGNGVPEIAFRIQQSVKQAVESMTRYKIAKIDVHVQEVVFPDELENDDPANSNGKEVAPAKTKQSN